MTDLHLVRLREAARRDQNNLCCYCACEMSDSSSGLETACTAEHVVPRSWGGRSTRRNIKAACYGCNNRRADGQPIHKKCGKKHERNRRQDDTVADRQERKMKERLSMWRKSCVMG